jgi:hypothetical protein
MERRRKTTIAGKGTIISMERLIQDEMHPAENWEGWINNPESKEVEHPKPILGVSLNGTEIFRNINWVAPLSALDWIRFEGGPSCTSRGDHEQFGR